MEVNATQKQSYYPLEKSSGYIEKGEFKGEWWNPLPFEVSNRINGKSWKENGPVPLTDLAYIRVTHWNLKLEETNGELVYHKNLAAEIVLIFQELFQAKFSINKMVLIDDYNADDELSMKDNNSSAFCCRSITGKSGTFSIHSYGRAIDINPHQNPYVKRSVVLPKEASEFSCRDQDSPGMIKKGDACYNAFVSRGYVWGGEWFSLNDYQHFEK